jgi:thiamine-phosphate pyrophosphorylase
MLDLATVPAVVLGGIDHSNIAEVLAAGAQNVCAVRCINSSQDPGAEIERLLAAIEEHRSRV